LTPIEWQGKDVKIEFEYPNRRNILTKKIENKKTGKTDMTQIQVTEEIEIDWMMNENN